MSLQQPKTAEDWILFLTPIIAALAGFNWGGIIPGASGFIVGVFIGALAKTLIGLGQNPHFQNYEDFVAAAILFLGFLATAFSANPQFLTWGTILGLVVKALGFLQSGLNVEDVFLAIGALIAGYGAISGNAQLTNAGLLLGLIGKAMPSIGTGGAAGTPAPTTAAPAG